MLNLGLLRFVDIIDDVHAENASTLGMGIRLNCLNEYAYYKNHIQIELELQRIVDKINYIDYKKLSTWIFIVDASYIICIL